MTPDLPPRSDTPTLRLMNHPRRVLDTGLAILVWIAVIGDAATRPDLCARSAWHVAARLTPI
jgi:hypothetical protein